MCCEFCVNCAVLWLTVAKIYTYYFWEESCSLLMHELAQEVVGILPDEAK
jgi:hypothetical protein